MISWGWVDLDWGWVVWLVMGLSLVLDISNISRVSISSVVSHNLGTAIGKGDPVLASGGVAVPLLVLGKVGTRVVISNGIAILVDSWLIIGWLGWVIWSWLVDNWSWVVDWGWVGNNNRGWVVWSRLVHNRGWVVNWSWLVVDWSGLVVDWSRPVVDWSMDWSMDWSVGWSMDSSAVLLSGIRVVDVLGSSMGLAGNNSSIRSVGLVDRVAHSWGISVLDDLVVGLVSSSGSQESRDSDKSLK